MITLYHGSNIFIEKIDLAQCNPYKDFGQAFQLTTDIVQAKDVANARHFARLVLQKNCCVMRVSEQEFRFMVEGITSDLIQLLMDREQYTLPQAVETVYGSSIYLALQRPSSGLYAQSSGYVYEYLQKELKSKARRPLTS